MIDYLLSLPSYALPAALMVVGLAVSLGGLLVNQKRLERKIEVYADNGTDARAQQQRQIDDHEWKITLLQNLHQPENRGLPLISCVDLAKAHDKLVDQVIRDGSKMASVEMFQGTHRMLAEHRRDITTLSQTITNLKAAISKKVIQPKVISKKQIAPVKPRKRVNGGAHVSR